MLNSSLPSPLQVILECPDASADSAQSLSACIFARSQHLRGTLAILHQAKAETARRLTDAIDLFNNAELDDSVHEDMDFEEYMTVESDSDCSSTSVSSSTSDDDE